MAAGDKSLFTNSHQTNIIKNDADPIFRSCEQHFETWVSIFTGIYGTVTMRHMLKMVRTSS